jgi:hypothetical protein
MDGALVLILLLVGGETVGVEVAVVVFLGATVGVVVAVIRRGQGKTSSVLSF